VAAGTDVGAYAINIGTLSAGGNYDLSLAGRNGQFLDHEEAADGNREQPGDGGERDCAHIDLCDRCVRVRRDFRNKRGHRKLLRAPLPTVPRLGRSRLSARSEPSRASNYKFVMGAPPTGSFVNGILTVTYDFGTGFLQPINDTAPYGLAREQVSSWGRRFR